MVTFKAPTHLALRYLQVSDTFHPSLAATVMGLMTVFYGRVSHCPSTNPPELMLKGGHQKRFFMPNFRVKT